MSLESFIGFDQGEGMSEAAFEAFKQKMKAASAQIAAIKKEEKKAKKKEDELLKILLKFIKYSKKKQLVLLISRVLEQNIPANFVLAVILLGNDEVQEEMKKFLMLRSGEVSTHEEVMAQLEAGIGDTEAEAGDKALIFFREDETLPLKAKIEMDAWMKALMIQAEEAPQKLLKTAIQVDFIEKETESIFDDKEYEKKESIKISLINLVAYVVDEFMEEHKIDGTEGKTHDFAKFILKGILDKTRENLENRKMLE